MAKFIPGDRIMHIETEDSRFRATIIEVLTFNGEYRLQYDAGIGSNIGGGLSSIELVDNNFIIDPKYLAAKEFDKELNDIINGSE